MAPKKKQKVEEDIKAGDVVVTDCKVPSDCKIPECDCPLKEFSESEVVVQSSEPEAKEELPGKYRKFL